MAVDIFAPLKERDPSDRLSVAGYIAAAALSGHDDLAAEAQSLTAVSQLIADVDIDALEDGGVATIPAEWQAKETVAKRSVLETEDQPQDGTATEAPSKRRRLRKSRMPKDFDPNKQPDPERWLPLRDRSSYRPPKGRKAKQRAAERTQGGFAAEGESASATSSGLGVAVTKTKSSGAGGKKKKGKGKK
ncbi:Signal recognition particle core component [Ascosphaera acerosa]|nr:Signal recognition particle core component [Ascosphaera acerosa]